MKRSAAILTAAVLLAAASAQADDKTVTLEQCAGNYGACVADCARDNPGTPGQPNPKMAACEGGCAGKRAVCEAEAGYEAAKPWVKEKYEKSKKFLQDLLRDHIDKPKEAPPKREGKTI